MVAGLVAPFQPHPRDGSALRLGSSSPGQPTGTLRAGDKARVGQTIDSRRISRHESATALERYPPLYINRYGYSARRTASHEKRGTTHADEKVEMGRTVPESEMKRVAGRRQFTVGT